MEESLLKQLGNVLRHPFDFLRVAVSPPFFRESGSMGEEKRKKIVLVFEASAYVLLILLVLVVVFTPSFWAISILFTATLIACIMYAWHRNDEDTPVLVIALHWMRNHPEVYITGALIVGILLWFLSGHFEILIVPVGLAVVSYMMCPPERSCYCNIED